MTYFVSSGTRCYEFVESLFLVWATPFIYSHETVDVADRMILIWSQRTFLHVWCYSGKKKSHIVVLMWSILAASHEVQLSHHRHGWMSPGRDITCALRWPRMVGHGTFCPVHSCCSHCGVYTTSAGTKVILSVMKAWCIACITGMFLHCLHNMLRNSSVVSSDVMKLVKIRIRQMGILTSKFECECCFIGLLNIKLEVSASCAVANKWSGPKMYCITLTEFVGNRGLPALLLEMTCYCFWSCLLYTCTYEIIDRTETFFHEFTFDKKAFKTFDVFWTCRKCWKFERCQMWMQTSSHSV